MRKYDFEKQMQATSYYNKFSRVYDILSPKFYYHKARSEAIRELRLIKEKSVLNVPVGTGQNFEYFQRYLKNSGLIVGVDISSGMLNKAQVKIDRNQWTNIKLLNQDVINLENTLKNELFKENNLEGFDAVFCDLGLSGFPHWKKIIDVLLSMLSENGRIAIMDWYIEKPSLRGTLVKWIGKGEVNRPIWQYLKVNVNDFKVDSSFNYGGVFVASGTKK
ncbi:class I SAM-dependent methyltransferase [uncultured Cocleimonas sp.]|jgi:ubiquinone/menaquinone biosynthesis C-methylase UbiE|uniref:class I SAM-dependent methyltransferase n=1 Tax=uncultured Cocleimonas sp. TaxID=1051587 RepID=UPI002639DB87|nr:methyltransferase domain-containing protein [uncultured Cocleimonas sp.]